MVRLVPRAVVLSCNGDQTKSRKASVWGAYELCAKGSAVYSITRLTPAQPFTAASVSPRSPAVSEEVQGRDKACILGSES